MSSILTGDSSGTEAEGLPAAVIIGGPQEAEFTELLGAPVPAPPSIRLEPLDDGHEESSLDEIIASLSE